MLIDEKWVSFIQADGLCNPVKLGSSSLLVEISYLVINKKNRNNQEPGPILTGIFIEKYPLPNNHYAKNEDVFFNPQNPVKPVENKTRNIASLLFRYHHLSCLNGFIRGYSYII